MFYYSLNSHYTQINISYPNVKRYLFLTFVHHKKNHHHWALYYEEKTIKRPKIGINVIWRKKCPIYDFIIILYRFFSVNRPFFWNFIVVFLYRSEFVHLVHISSLIQRLVKLQWKIWFKNKLMTLPYYLHDIYDRYSS